jgi:Holliday junction resolvase
MSINSCQKGKRGERNLAAFLRDEGFDGAKRGQQHAGGVDSPDVVGVPGWHIECKCTAQIRLRDWMAQAERDSKGKPWAILYKLPRGPWVTIIKATEWTRLIRETLDPQVHTPSEALAIVSERLVKDEAAQCGPEIVRPECNKCGTPISPAPDFFSGCNCDEHEEGEL